MSVQPIRSVEGIASILAESAEDQALRIIWDNRLVDLFRFRGACPTNVTEIKQWLVDPATEMQRDEVLHLDLSNLGLDVIPPQLAHFKRLKDLNLEHNGITFAGIEIFRRAYSEPGTFRGQEVFSQLYELRLGHNQIDYIDSSFLRYMLRHPTLLFIDLTGNPIRSFDSEEELLAHNFSRFVDLTDTGINIFKVHERHPHWQPDSSLKETRGRLQPWCDPPQPQPDKEQSDYVASENEKRLASSLEKNNDGGIYKDESAEIKEMKERYRFTGRRRPPTGQDLRDGYPYHY